MPNPSGIPERIRSGIENLSGMDLSDVRVHYNSPEPALAAHAYAQGTDIYLAPGQERTLPHEVWHVVQQRQGRVSETGRSHIGLSKDAGALKMEAELAAKRTPF